MVKTSDFENSGITHMEPSGAPGDDLPSAGAAPEIEVTPANDRSRAGYFG